MQPPTAEKFSILVVDDEAMVRRVARSVLARQGYDVLEADGIEAALDVARSRPVDLVVVDYHMPRAVGPQVVAALREVIRDLRVVYMTGSRGIALKGIDGEPLLLKPFTGEELARAVGDALAPATGAGDRARPG